MKQIRLPQGPWNLLINKEITFFRIKKKKTEKVIDLNVIKVLNDHYNEQRKSSFPIMAGILPYPFITTNC